MFKRNNGVKYLGTKGYILHLSVDFTDKKLIASESAFWWVWALKKAEPSVTVFDTFFPAPLSRFPRTRFLNS